MIFELQIAGNSLSKLKLKPSLQFTVDLKCKSAKSTEALPRNVVEMLNVKVSWNMKSF